MQAGVREYLLIRRVKNEEIRIKQNAQECQIRTEGNSKGVEGDGEDEEEDEAKREILRNVLKMRKQT